MNFESYSLLLPALQLEDDAGTYYANLYLHFFHFFSGSARDSYFKGTQASES